MLQTVYTDRRNTKGSCSHRENAGVLQYIINDILRAIHSRTGELNGGTVHGAVRAVRNETLCSTS